MISLAGKAALVTGGSRGIGAATVKMFAQVAQETRKHGTRIESFKADLGRAEDARKLVQHARERLGRLDILVTNAGIWNHNDAPIEKLTEREWDEMIRVNLKSMYSTAHFTVPHMIAQGGGRMVTVASLAGQRGTPFHTHYSATIGAIIGFTKALALELARHNILVNCIAPGFVGTDIWKSESKNTKKFKQALAAYPLNRLATPDEVAGPILFAVSDLATFVTAEVINVNGGSFPCG